MNDLRNVALRCGLAALLIPASLMLSACGDEDGSPSTGPQTIASELGIDKYKGQVDPISSTVNGNETTWFFDINDGPGCLKGGQYKTHTRDTDSDSLLIFLQGGGACWSEFCLAVTGAPDELPSGANLLDPTKENNPFRDWNVIYLPYCDGSIFVGDNDRDIDGDGEIDFYYRGLHNLTASLDIAKEQFPDVERIVLAGASAGGFGTLLGAPLVRSYYPDADFVVIDDAGVGIGRPGDDEFIETLIAEFGADKFLPPDCDDCIQNGTITGVIDWYMQRDTEIRIAAISSWYDTLITRTFLKIDPVLFQQTLELELGALNAAYPDRFKRFIYGGTGHTATLGDVSGVVGSDLSEIILPPNSAELLLDLKIEDIDSVFVDGVVLADWLGSIFGPDEWVDLTAPVGEPPE